MDLSGFSSANGFGGNTNASPVTVSPQAQSRGGLLSRIIGSFTAAPKYFLNTDIVNPVKELAAQATGNKTAFQNAQKAQAQTIGSTPGEAVKRLAGNTAQLATMVLAPEAKAGIGANVLQGAKVGAVAGGGSAAANDQNVLKGAIEGAAVGGVANPIANGILSKVLPKGTPEVADSAGSGTNSVSKNINNHLQQTEAAAGGFNAGAKLPGSGPSGISLNESQNLSALSNKYGIPAGSPATRLQAIQSKLNDATTNLHNVISDNNVPVSADDRQNIISDFNKRIAEQPNANDLQSKATDLADHLNGEQKTGATLNGEPLDPEVAKALGVSATGKSPINDLQDLNGYRQKLDGIINYSRSQGSPNPVGEQVATILRHTISDHIGNMSPEVSAANKTFSELKSLEAPTLDANNQIAHQGGGLYNRLLNNSVVKGAEAKVANVGQKLTGGINKGVTPKSEMPNIVPTTPPGVLGKVISRGIPVKYESDVLAGRGTPQSSKITMTNPSIADIENQLENLKGNGFSVNQKFGRTPGSLDSFGGERGLTPHFTPIAQSPKVSTIELSGSKTSVPLVQQGKIEKGVINTPDIYEEINNLPITNEAKQSLLSKLSSNPQLGSYLQRESVVAPSAAVGNQQTSSSIPTAPGEATATAGNNDVLGMGSPNTTDTLGLNGATASSTDNDPFSEDSIKAAILQDIQTTGGKNVAALTSLYNTFGKAKSEQSTAEKNTTDTLNSALATLNTYNDQLNASGGGRGAVAGNFYNDLGAIPILGGGSTATSVRAIESQKTDVATSIAKALTGGKPSSAQIKSWENAIPNVTDSPEVAKQKMANITASIQAKLATYPQGQ